MTKQITKRVVPDRQILREIERYEARMEVFRLKYDRLCQEAMRAGQNPEEPWQLLNFNIRWTQAEIEYCRTRLSLLSEELIRIRTKWIDEVAG